LLRQVHQSISRLIDGEHGTTIEIALYGFCIPERGIHRTKGERAGTNALITLFFS
jgi:hypothetical protein